MLDGLNVAHIGDNGQVALIVGFFEEIAGASSDVARSR